MADKDRKYAAQNKKAYHDYFILETYEAGIELFGTVKQEGLALVPLSVYFNDKGKAKMQIGLCKGKKNYDKREAQAKKDAQRDIERGMRQKY